MYTSCCRETLRNPSIQVLPIMYSQSYVSLQFHETCRFPLHSLVMCLHAPIPFPSDQELSVPLFPIVQSPMHAMSRLKNYAGHEAHQVVCAGLSGSPMQIFECAQEPHHRASQFAVHLPALERCVFVCRWTPGLFSDIPLTN